MSQSQFQADFGGTPLAAGTTRGARSWKIDRLGRLVGVYGHIWLPGENQAICKPETDAYVAEMARLRRHMSRQQTMLYDATTVFPLGGIFRRKREQDAYTVPSFGITDEDLAALQPQPCGGADPGCTCGFYAYYGDEGTLIDDYPLHDTQMSPTWGSPPPMLAKAPGIVEGYGLTTVGTKGFRAMKARIVAVHLHAELGVDIGRRVRHNYPDVTFVDGLEMPLSAMYRAFPPDPVELPTPETDPEFWTRKIS